MFSLIQAFGKIEVQQANGVNSLKLEVPISTTLSLFTYRESGIEDGSILEKLLIHILHLNDELLSFLVLTIYIKYCPPCIRTITELF